jgi:ankyrin repeat protein
MSKYLDALLWKNSKERNSNNINVNMKDREGATALYCAAIRGRPDSTRSLIEAGANVNARLGLFLPLFEAEL